MRKLSRRQQPFDFVQFFVCRRKVKRRFGDCRGCRLNAACGRGFVLGGGNARQNN
ncbi:MAG: hypothetical protein ACLSE6_04095 [Alphaproteobacteria bacterium]